jgi:hypothetical protein
MPRMWKLRLSRILTSLATVEPTCQDEHPEDNKYDWPKANRYVVIGLQEQANANQDYYGPKHQRCYSAAIGKTKAFIFNPSVVFSFTPWIPLANGVDGGSAVGAISRVVSVLGSAFTAVDHKTTQTSVSAV